MKYLTYIFIAGLMTLLVGCGVSTEDVASTEEVSVVKEVAEIVNTATPLPPTSTPTPLAPTATPVPTSTQSPVPTSTPDIDATAEVRIEKEAAQVEVLEAVDKIVEKIIEVFVTPTPLPTPTPFPAIDVKDLTSQYQYDIETLIVGGAKDGAIPEGMEKSDFKKKYQGKNLQIYVKGLIGKKYSSSYPRFWLYITNDEMLPKLVLNDPDNPWGDIKEPRTSILTCQLADEAYYQYDQVGIGDTVIVTGIFLVEEEEFLNVDFEFLFRPKFLQLNPCNVVQINPLPLTPTPLPTPTPTSVIPTPIIMD